MVCLSLALAGSLQTSMASAGQSAEAANKLLADALAVDESEVTLRQSYSAKMGKVLTATKVARDLQIEKKIRAIIKFELASQIPLAS